MNDFLNKQKIDYILYHLQFYINLSAELKKNIICLNSQDEIKSHTNKIIFILSKKPFSLSEVIYYNEIPILFPVNKNKNLFEIKNSNLIFNHDILKSAFYLLSGYQEYKNQDKDNFGRFSYNSSVQKKLNITDKPIVNYYFKIIADAINEFFKTQDKVIKQKKIFKNFAFFLTHDIDNVTAYSFNKLLYKIKEIFNLVKSNYSFFINIKLFFKIIFELLKFNNKANPFWSFSYLRKIERKLNFRSAFYFLEKHEKNLNSNYYFNENRMHNLFTYLINEKCEIGLHGTRKSALSEKELSNTLTHLNKELPITVKGIRQHLLLYSIPETALLHEKAKLKYDTTLAFAEHEGFRNSYCFPFKLYDFEKDRTINIWEIPLIVMDVTLFYYRKFSLDEAKNAITNLLKEIRKFNGVFTLLWHNDFFDEDLFPGITLFYENLLDTIHSLNPENLLGVELINKYLTN